jgi:hypothetical protein
MQSIVPQYSDKSALRFRYHTLGGTFAPYMEYPSRSG